MMGLKQCYRLGLPWSFHAVATWIWLPSLRRFFLGRKIRALSWESGRLLLPLPAFLDRCRVGSQRVHLFRCLQVLKMWAALTGQRCVQRTQSFGNGTGHCALMSSGSDSWWHCRYSISGAKGLAARCRFNRRPVNEAGQRQVFVQEKRGP